MKKAFLTALGLVFALMLLSGPLCSLPASASPIISEIDRGGWELPLPKGLKELENMVVTIRDGFVCVTDKSGAVIFTTDISSDSLTEADRRLLSEGITASDYGALIRIIENYNS